MWARPVARRGSCEEPASTSVKKEKTGASGRSHTKSVRPLGSFFTVMRFSNDATSCARAKLERRKRTTAVLKVRRFIGPPTVGRASSATDIYWTGLEGRSLKVRVRG